MSNTTLTGAIVLRWRNRNILDIDGTNIYRSESPMDKENLPEPYDFVGEDEDKFVDYDVELFKDYYYKIGVVNGDEELISEGQQHFRLGNDLTAPFDLRATFYEDGDSGDLQEPFSLSGRYDRYQSYTK